MQTIVNGETPFKAINRSFTIGPAEAEYVLNFSVSKEGPFTPATEDATPVGENHIVNGCTPFSWFKLVGNTGDVQVIL